jgi:hypothetical protein
MTRFTGIRLAFVLAGIGVGASVVEASPPAGGGEPLPPGTLFQTSDNCMACHNNLTTPSGEDVSIGFSWRASMMANSARDPYWHAAVRREVIDHPESQAAIEAECSRCHMPMATFEAEAGGAHGQVFANLPIGQSEAPSAELAADGVSCTVCHQIEDVNFGEKESFTGHFVVDASTDHQPRAIYGPHDVDAGRAHIMESASSFRPAEGNHIQQSELCATCHTLYTHSLGPGGEVLGELPEQTPYEEWLHSDYKDEKSCQDCHMPVVEEPTAIASVWGQPRPDFSRHEFRGGNFFMMRMLNRYRAELGVTALPQEFDKAANRTIEHLQTDAATLSVETELTGGGLWAEVVVDNLAGHKLPTAYPSRRAWIHLTVRDANGELVFESGAFRPDGSIAGNDNDEDPRKYEPHHAEIDRAEDVQIYESVLAGPDGAVTTGLLTGVKYAKDNRLLPLGFEKDSAPVDVAVRGAADGDPDFGGGRDRVRYSVDVSGASGPFTVEASLWYQPIGFRWAENLREYDAFETNRFVRYYESMSAASAVVIAQASGTTN